MSDRRSRREEIVKKVKLAVASLILLFVFGGLLRTLLSDPSIAKAVLFGFGVVASLGVVAWAGTTVGEYFDERALRRRIERMQKEANRGRKEASHDREG